MSPMSKARAVSAVRPATPPSASPASRRKRRVTGAMPENFVLAFLDALRDILREETRVTA